LIPVRADAGVAPLTDTVQPDSARHEGSLDRILTRLVCPRCHAPFTSDGVDLTCTNPACGFVGAFIHDVAVLGDRAGTSFFDDKHEVMTVGNKGDGVFCLCYERQAAIVESRLRPGAVVLDVGCGPRLPYARPEDAFVIGLDASYESIRVNRDVDVRVYGSGTEIPLPDDSVDMLVAYYAVHHMTGRTQRINRKRIAAAFREFGRVVKPGGEVLVFEVSPWAPFRLAEHLFWDQARAIIGRGLDMYFYSAREYDALGRMAFPDATPSVQTFGSSMLSTFPPAFGLPWLRLPRFIYPFDVNLYRWRL
jgi:ubiquinone/menaquinone biosynthesis C-methylase UbiE